MSLNLFTKPLDVFRGPIPQYLSNVPPRALAQLTPLALALTLTALTPRALALDRLLDVPHALLHKRARRLRLKPAREHIPPRSARRHLKLDVPRAIDELEHRMRRIVPRTMSKLVYARVAAGPLRVARRERVKDFGHERGPQEEACCFFPRWVRALFAERDDLGGENDDEAEHTRPFQFLGANFRDI